MASKKLKTKDTDLDSNLDFPEFDWDVADASDDREPTSKPAKSFAKGVKKGIGDTDLIKTMFRKNLPKEYGDTFDKLDDLQRGSRDFAENVMKEAKPVIGHLANAAEKFLPNNFKTAKEKLAAIRDWSEKEDYDYRGQSKEDREEDQISIGLERVFEKQQAIDAQAEKVGRQERAIDRGIGMAQHKDVLSVLNRISTSTNQVAAYTSMVTSAWQRKSLETQYRALFLQRDQFEEQKKSNAEIIASLVSITKNSALPEYRKTQQDEAFLEEARRKFSSKIVDASHNFMKKGLMKMKEDITGAVSDLANVTSMLSLAADMQAMEDEFDPQTLTDRFATAGGKKTGQWILSKGGDKLFKTLKKNPKAVEAILRGQQFLRSFQQDGAGIASEMFEKGREKGGFLGMLSSYLGDTFTLDQPNFSLQGFDHKNLHNAAPFSNKVAMSMTDVIPGYLARILQSNEMARLGKNVDLVKFDWRSGKFSTTSKIVESIKKSISPEELSRNNDYYLKEVMATIEEHADLTPAERDDIARALMKTGSSGTAMNPSKMTDVHHWGDIVKEYSTAEKLAEAMKAIYGTESDKEFYGTGMKAQQKAQANEFIKQVKDLKNMRKDLYAQAQFLMDNDMLDEAQKAELIDRFESLNIDLIDRNTTRTSGSYKGKGTKMGDINEEYANSKNELDGHDKGMVQKAADLLKKGVKKATGGFTADSEGYLVDEKGERKLDSEGNPIIVGTSDVHAKRDIRGASNMLGWNGKLGGKDTILDRLTRTPIHEWRYKKGRGDGGLTTNTGPMAQDMRRQFGDDMAPGGTTIDLVNANGMTMKAIQELNAKVDGFGGGGGNGGSGNGPAVSGEMGRPMNAFEALLGIYQNTYEMKEQGRSMINLSAEGFKNLFAGLGIGNIDLSGLSGAAREKYEEAMKMAKNGKAQATSFLGRIGDLISGVGGEMLGEGWKRGKQAAGLLWKGAVGTKNFLSDVADRTKIKAMETFDVYVDGEDEPRMVAVKMRQDKYVNGRTGALIKTRKDVRDAAKHGIKEVDGDKSFYVIRKKEMDSVYFVNTYKNAIERLITGGVDILKNSAKTVWGSIVSPLFKSGFEIGKKARSLALNLMDQPMDIFVKGRPDAPVLMAKKMRDGAYVDFANGTPITRPSQIRGAVFDVEKKEIALSVDDFREGLVDIYGKPIEGSAMMRAGKFVLGTGAAAAFSVGKWSVGKLMQAPGVFGKMARKGADILGGIADKIGLPSISFGGKQVISILEDIRNILRYQAGLTSDISDLKNVIGNSAIAQNVKEAIKATTSDSEEGSMEEGAEGPGFFSRMKSSFMNIFKRKNKRKGVPEANIASKGGLVPYRRPYDDVYPIDNSRPETYSAGNTPGGIYGLLGQAAGGLLGWGGRKALGTSAAQKYLPAPMKNGLTALFKQSEGEGNQSQNDQLRQMLLGGPAPQRQRRDNSGAQEVAYRDVNERKGSWQERVRNDRNRNKESAMEKAKVRVYETKNIFSMITGALGKLKDKFFGGTDETNSLLKDIRNILAGDAAMDALGGAGGDGKGKKGKGNGKKAGRFGRLGKLGSLGLKGLGIAGTAYSGYSAYQNVKEGNYGEAAVDVGLGAVGLGATVAGVGATASWLGGAAMTLGTGALAVLSSPVVLAGLAGAAVGYLGYKGYQFLTRKKFNYTEIMRMLEYGLRGGDEDKMRKLYELELYMDKVSKLSGTELSIDKKFNIVEVAEIFDIGKKDEKRKAALLTWFERRFKPIYAKWKAMVNTVSGQDKLEWIEKAKGDKLLELFRLFKLTDSAYYISDSPFKDIPMNTNAKVISNFKDEWLLSIKKEAVDKKDETLGRDVAATGKAVLDARAQGKEATFDTAKTGADAISQTNETNSAGAKVTVSSEFAAGYVSNTVNALDSIRYKSYGLVNMKASIVSAFRNLESITMDSVKIDSSGKATFDGDVKEIVKKAGGYFGVGSGESEFLTKWTNWYMNRFLPVYLAMHSAIFAITKRAELRTNVRYLERATPSESLVIARAMMGAKGIWEIKDFAFKGQVAGTNPNICDENIMFIENMAKEETVKEQKATKATVTPPTAADAVKEYKAPPEKKADTPKSDSPGPKTAAQSMGVSDEPEQKAFTDDAPGQKDMIKATSSAMAAGTMPVAPGELFSGAGGLAFLTLANGANIEGLHPSVKRLFLGMAEEYGKLTGKKLQVNTAYRSFKEQEALYKKYGPGRAARPGSSLHEYGLALDVQSADLEQLEKLGLLRKYGFTRPLGSEPWHIEPAGIHDNAVRQKSKTDHGYATQFIESGVGRGGGGLGSRGRKGELRRDDLYAKQLFDAGSQVAKSQGDDQGKAPPPPSPGQQMTQAATDGAASKLNNGGLAGGMSDVETPEGKVQVNRSGTSGDFSAKSIGDNAAQATKELQNTSYDITTAPKGSGGVYSALPDADGKGWSGTGLLIKEAAKMVGVDPGLAAAIAAKESSLNPAAQGKNSSAGNSVAQGLYQFMPGTWKDVLKKYGKKYGIPENASPLDPKANALMGMEYFKASGDGTVIGSYLGHMLGPGGFRTFSSLRDNDYPANVLKAAAANNPNIFYHGGDRSKPRTKSEFMSFIGTQINKQLADFKIPLKINAQVGGETQVAANDANGGMQTAGYSSATSKISESGGNEYIKTGAGAVEPARPVNVPAPSKPSSSGVGAYADTQPIASGNRTAPAVDNQNNGTARLVTIAEQHIDEARRTNGILVEIRDLLSEFIAEKTKAPEPSRESSKTASDRAVDATKQQPASLPDSYVQRRRMA